MDNYSAKCKGFEWDKGNSEKNRIKHGVLKAECEQIFFNNPLMINNDEKHSQFENRYYALGKTNKKRMLFVVFTVRNELIRVISARDMSKKEREVYNQ
jgi:uncharacterized DUF497 family protein